MDYQVNNLLGAVASNQESIPEHMYTVFFFIIEKSVLPCASILDN